ncbi:hypothetical protein CsSME_00013593 [Camellia sinensis var. sinensis]
MTLVGLCWLPWRGAPAVVSNGFSPLPLLRASFREPTEIPLTDQALNLVFKVNTLFGVMVVVLVEAVVFGLVSPVKRRSRGLGPFEGIISLNLVQDLFHGGVEGCVSIEPAGRSSWR